ncbi:MAG: type II secretion system F family protein [Actinomycetes bacterium]
MDAVLTAGLAALAGGMALGLATLASGADDRQRVQRQLAAIAATRVGGAQVLTPEEVSFADRVIGPVFSMAARLASRLTPSGFVGQLQHKLDIAGNPASFTPQRVLSLKGFGLAIGGVLGLLYGSGVLAVLLAVAGGAAGFYIPDLLVYNAGLKRQQDMGKALPDAMDLLTISVEAGLGFDAALSQVARNTEGPLAGEFMRVLQEMQIGKSRGDAFRALADRTSVPELKAFVSSLTQADAFGIPVANVLREQSKELRVKRRQKAEEKAQKVPVKIMVPLVLFIFPVIFIVILGPAAAGWFAR